MKPTLQHIPSGDIVMDVRTQLRASINTAVVQEYAEAMVRGEKFPPVDVFRDGKKFRLADGWHRMLAMQTDAVQEVRPVKVEANVFEGGLKEAVKHALGVNGRHGLNRTQADKQKAIEVALKEFPDLSDRAIAELCCVSDKTVAAHRPNCGISAVPEKRKGLDGKYRPAVPSKPRAEQAVIELAPATPPAAPALSLEEIQRLTRLAQEHKPVVAVEAVRAPILRPSEKAGTFDSAAWKAGLDAELRAWLARVPEKQQPKARQWIADWASQGN